MNKSLSIPRRRGGRCQRGLAAIEFALCLPVLVALLVLPVFFARAFWHYTMAQKAAQNAARYLAGASAAELGAPDAPRAASRLAREIVQRQIAEMSQGAVVSGIDVACDESSCADTPEGRLPATVRVSFQVTMSEPGGLAGFGWYDLPINASYTLRHAGN
ncbi:TadE/TadG family type IV pilus assembly protein [Massilia sp. MS-15]|uniref:TadE/TadG family type IV pilus assembly protein n=1 Tax=Massilia sp. MS-15 TaxID=2878200 RepID=UPI001CD41A99|nr:TadE/TadG family type IV pilus assembly protein [Massilia sp. MS-15]MCA1245703.1 pilus assembly protein [Massilia sp. MS-15]